MALDVEQIFGAVDVIVKQRLQEVSFDKTIVCTITDDSDKKNGHYIVTNGNIRFDAYTTNVNYRVDDQVRVSILNGDFSEKKFIIGKYVADNTTTPIAYTSPLTGIVPISDNLVTNLGESGTGVFGIKANGENQYIPIQSWDLESDSSFRDLQSNGIYSTISLSADFKTLLSNYSLSSGRYGLLVLLGIRPAADSQLIYRYELLDSSEMFGNPYAFAIYSHQEKKINIASSGTIAAMALYLYQTKPPADQENPQPFKDNRGNLIPVNKYSNDIFVKNISIGFGSDIASIPDNTVEIYTKDSLSYVYENATAQTNEKDIELLWYNKDDNNNYIGFEDGIYAPTYDEIEYLKASHQDSRLVAQVGRTGIPSDKDGLKLAADIQEARPILIQTREKLTVDLKAVLQGLLRQVTSVNIFKSELNKLLDPSATGKLVSEYNNSQIAVTNLFTAYDGVLEFAYNKQNNISGKTWDSSWETDYYTAHKTAINNAITSVQNFCALMEENTQSQKDYSGYRGIYETYVIRIDRVIEDIKWSLKQTDGLLNDNHSVLIAYKNKNTFTEYLRKDFSDFHNKYCIYWYRYEKGYIIPSSDEDEYKFGRFMPDGWRRLTDMTNKGLPVTEGKTIEQKTYYPAKPLDGQYVTRYMDINYEEEKYVAILFHNHEMCKSNMLTFTNIEAEKIPNDYFIDKHDALQIKHDAQSFEHYQSYDIDNTLINIADGGKIRQLFCSYDGLISGDEALADAHIYWYVPNTSTMLTFDKEDLKNRGFTTDADLAEDERNPEYSRAGYTYFYKKIAEKKEIINEEEVIIGDPADRFFFYKIKPYYEQVANQNTIEVYAYIPGRNEPVIGSISFTFSTFGTNGTRYTMAIVPAETQCAVIGDSTTPLKLNVSLRDASNQVIPLITATTTTEQNAGYAFKVDWHGPSTYIPQVLESDGQVTGLSITKNKNPQNSQDCHFYGILKATTSFKYDDEVAQQEANVNNTAEVEKYQKYRVLDLHALYPVPYSSSDLFYISGPTSIIYNNQGTVSHMSEDPFCLYRANVAPGDTTSQIVENQKWSLEYYDEQGNWITPDNADQWKVLINYMPVLNSSNGLTPAPLYMDGLNYFPVAVCTNDNDDILWVQPIVITQNRYASSTLNDWNGSFTIDEKNGTILSTMIGAGKKNADNSFSGVLMGDIGAGANFDIDNYDGLGLYGFNEGAQSFAFTVDGKAFLGKAGRGRIYFDGDSGTISSASYQQNRIPIEDDNGKIIGYEDRSIAGMMVDLDDGFIDIHGTVLEEEHYSPQASKLTQEEWDELPDDGNKHNSYSAYEKAYEADATTVDRKQSHIRIDVQSPYFTIHSANQINNKKHLMLISDNEYYLQTDNYAITDFPVADNTAASNGQGFKLDLMDGIIDAYNLKLTSKNLFINSIDENKPYLIIKNDDGRNLMLVDNNNYYLQSADYEPMSDSSLGKGMKLVFSSSGEKTGIEAYSFNLRAGNVGSGDHAIVLSDSGNPYFMINTDVDGVTKTLVNISTTEQSFQSSDYNGIDTGIRLSLSAKEFKAYSGFTLKAYNDKKYIKFDSNASNYPFEIYGGGATVSYKDAAGNSHSVESSFKVDWNGQVNATGGTFNAINAINATFAGNITANGTITGGTMVGATIQGGVLKVGPTVGETGYQLYADDLEVTIQNARIINCTIENGDGSPQPTSGFSVTSAGIMTGLGCSLTKGVFEECTVTEKLTCNGDIYVDSRNHLYFGNKGAALGFSDQSLSLTGSLSIASSGGSGGYLSCSNIKCSSISPHFNDGTAESGNITVNADLVMGDHSIVANTVSVKGTLQVGNSTIEDYIKDILQEAGYATEEWVTKQGYSTDSGVTKDDVKKIVKDYINSPSVIIDPKSHTHGADGTSPVTLYIKAN